MADSNTDLIPVHVVELVKKKHSDKRQAKVKQIVNYIVKDLQKNDIITKNDLGAIIRCCELIENMCKHSDKINKLEIVYKVFSIVCAYPPAEHHILKNIVQELLDRNAIKKVKYSYQVYSYVKKVIVSNFFFYEH